MPNAHAVFCSVLRAAHSTLHTHQLQLFCGMVLILAGALALCGPHIC